MPTIKETFLCNRKWSTETNIKSRLSRRQKKESFSIRFYGPRTHVGMMPISNHFRFRPLRWHQSYSRRICDFGEFFNRLIRLSKWHNKKLPIISPIINALESNPDYEWLDDDVITDVIDQTLNRDFVYRSTRADKNLFLSRKLTQQEVKKTKLIWRTSQKINRF